MADDQTLISGGANATYASKVTPSTATDLVTDPFVEQIGRFCPIGDTQPTLYNPSVPGHGLSAASLLDFGQDPRYWHYHWTKRLFDYITVQAPHDDYFPNVDPIHQDTSVSPSRPARYLPSDPDSDNFDVNQINPVSNTGSGFANALTAGRSEDLAGVEGLININTASWRVLSMLPFVPRGTDMISDTASLPDGIDDNINIARAIVDYRNLNGPFASLSDLYNVPAFRLANDQLLNNGDPGIALGDTSPGDGTADGVRFDFEERFLLLNRISNLITTRSDFFTCYLLLQGWRNAGTTNATLCVERRAAFFADRTGVHPAVPTATNLPDSHQLMRSPSIFGERR